jgi:hypothetical protein
MTYITRDEVPDPLLSKERELQGTLIERAMARNVTSERIEREGRWMWHRDKDSGKHSLYLLVGSGRAGKVFATVAEGRPMSLSQVTNMREGLKRSRSRKRRNSRTGSQTTRKATAPQISGKELIEAYDDLRAAEGRLRDLGVRVTVAIT